MRELARRIMNNQVQLRGDFGVLSNEDPPKSFCEQTRFAGWLFAAPQNEQHRCVLSNGTTVKLYQLFPLYAEEIILQRDKGFAALIEQVENTGSRTELRKGALRSCHFDLSNDLLLDLHYLEYCSHATRIFFA
ncbi:suppressor of fused domain protein [Roseiconus lacunae]|nr:suppressor of fused domain protein [Roseiconus lacunae]